MGGAPRKIIHVDMDCFYAAVEVKHRPELKGKPLGVGGPAESRSVLCTASYEARKFGVRSAMPSATAKRLCPGLILVPPQFDLYRRESYAVHEIFRRFTDRIEPLSLDEAYLDVSDSPLYRGSATLIAREIRACIRRELGLSASAGVAPNKFLAKVASDWNKPDGQFVIRPEQVPSFVRALPVEKIHGVGKVTAGKMHALGLKSCADLQERSLEELQGAFGSSGEYFFRVCRGIDERPVEAQRERKSLSVEETYDRDLLSLEECQAALPHLFQDFERRLGRSELQERVRGIVVKLKDSAFRSTTRECSQRGWPALRDFERLLAETWSRKRAPVRLIGIGVRLRGEELGDPEKDESIRPWQFALRFS